MALCALSLNVAVVWPGCRLRKREEVQVLPLDQVLRDALGGLEGRVGAMKVDVEGFELGVRVWEDSRRTILRGSI